MRRRGALGQIVDLRDPVNWRHPLNAGLINWVLAVPNTSGGKVAGVMAGPAFNFHAAGTGSLNYFPTSVHATLPRPGGWGFLNFSPGNGFYTQSAVLPTLTNFSMSVWLIQTPGSPFVPVSNCDASYVNGIRILYISNVPYSDFFSGSSETTTQWGSALTNYTWHHIAMTHTAGATSITMYVDGVAGGSSAHASAANPGTSTGPLTIGADGAGHLNGWGGGVDDLRIYNRVLSATEVKQLYNLSQVGYPGLLNRVSRTLAPPILPRVFPAQVARVDPKFYIATEAY